MSTTEQQTAVRAAIEVAINQFVDAFRRRDAAGCARVYTEEAALLPPNAEIVRGRQAIQQAWQGVLDAGLTDCRVETLDVESAGDLAYEVGRLTLYAGEHHIADEGKYIAIWKREAGQWKLHRDIWNSSRPA
jgi:uncharacterized protein (TIGR02246 family)